MEYTIGQVVYSKGGRDKGKPFIITAVEGEYVYLADGNLRKLEKPKKKKQKHVQMTKFVHEQVKQKLETKSYILDADIKKALKEYIEKELVK